MNPQKQSEYEEASRLLGKTLRTVVILVAATVLFVGALSAGAMFVASRAVAAAPASADTAPATASGAKKPLSI